MAPSPGDSRELVLPEVTSPPPSAASDPTGSGGRKPEGPVLRRTRWPRCVSGAASQGLGDPWRVGLRSRLGGWGAPRKDSGWRQQVPGLSPTPVHPPSCRGRRDHGPRIWASGTGAACDHLQLVALRAARLPALLQQGHPQRAAPNSGVHPSRRTAWVPWPGGGARLPSTEGPVSEHCAARQTHAFSFKGLECRWTGHILPVLQVRELGHRNDRLKVTCDSSVSLWVHLYPLLSSELFCVKGAADSDDSCTFWLC